MTTDEEVASAPPSNSQVAARDPTGSGRYRHWQPRPDDQARPAAYTFKVGR